MKLPIRNKDKEIIDYTIVSKNDFNILNKYKWNKDRNGYIQGYITNKYWFLHRYILIELHKIKPESEKHKIVDHINHNPLDNRLKNLRFVTFSENIQNSKKRKNTTSIYKGVSKFRNIWRTSITINNKYYAALYKDELHAAHQYNLWIDKFKLSTAVKNKIKKPKNFIEWEKREVKRQHTHINKANQKYYFNIQINKYYNFSDNFHILNNAIKIRDNMLKIKCNYILVLKQLKNFNKK